MAGIDVLLWPLLGAGLGALLGWTTGACRRDLDLSPIGLAVSSGVISLAASIFIDGAEAAVFAAAISVLALTDLKRRILPNELTYGLIVAGVLFALIGPRDPVLALVGACLGATVLWSLRALWLWRRGEEALGLGDVKMLAGVGAFLGPLALPEVVLWSATGGIALGVMMMLKGEQRPEIPFGAALSLAAWLHMACGPILTAP